MKTKHALRGLSIAVVLQLGVLAGSAQTIKYLFSGSETNITLPPGTYIITAYGAPGGNPYPYSASGLGAEMSGEFNFSASTTLTLLVGGGGDIAIYNYVGGGGGGGSFVVESNTPLVIAGGGGGYGGTGGVHEDGTVSTNGSNGGGNGGYGYGYGGTGGGGGGGGGYGPGIGIGGYVQHGGGGGGGFLGNGGTTTNELGYSSNGGGGSSFENGGNGGAGGNGYSGSFGGFGGGGGGTAVYLGGGETVGGGGGGGGYSGGGGGDANTQSSPGGGGGSIIDSSAITNLTERSGIRSPDDPANGEIIITVVPVPVLPFQITSIVRTNAHDLLITWNTSGTSNILQVTAGTGARGSFSTNGFTDLTNLVVTTATTNFWDAGAATNYPARYYRIRSPQ